MQKYKKYPRGKNYLTINSVLRVIFFVKILFLKVSFRNTHIDVHAAFACGEQIVYYKNTWSTPLHREGAVRDMQGVWTWGALVPQAHLQIPPSCRENGSAPSTARFAKLPITADFSKSPYAIIVSSSHPYPRKCHKDTWNTHQIPKNLSNPLLFAQKREKNRCSSIAISEKLPTFALAFRKGAQNEIFERLRTRRKRQGSAAWKRAAKRCQFL